MVPPIAAFVAAGFEHSVANMYFVPFAAAFLTRNLMPVTIELVEARATMGEIVKRLRNVFGSWQQNTCF